MKKNYKDDPILTGKAKEKETKDLHQKEWKYPARGCKICLLYPCFKGQENMVADYAKYGCVDYQEDELRKL